MINILRYYSSVQFGGTLFCEHFEFGDTDTSRHLGATPMLYNGSRWYEPAIRQKPSWRAYSFSMSLCSRLKHVLSSMDADCRTTIPNPLVKSWPRDQRQTAQASHRACCLAWLMLQGELISLFGLTVWFPFAEPSLSTNTALLSSTHGMDSCCTVRKYLLNLTKCIR